MLDGRECELSIEESGILIAPKYLACEIVVVLGRIAYPHLEFQTSAGALKVIGHIRGRTGMGERAGAL